MTASGMDLVEPATIRSRIGGTMSAKTIAIWSTGIVLLAIAAIAWLGYVAYGIAYGDALGAPGITYQDLAVTGARAAHFLGLALASETVGVGIIVWRILNDKAMKLKIMASTCVGFFISACTFEMIRPT